VVVTRLCAHLQVSLSSGLRLFFVVFFFEPLILGFMFYVSARGNFAGKSKPMNQNFPVVFPYNFSANFSRLTGNTRTSLLRRKPSKRPYRVPPCVPWPRWCLSTALHNYTHTHTTTVTLDIFLVFRED